MESKKLCSTTGCANEYDSSVCGYGRCPDHCASTCLHRPYRSSVKEMAADIGKSALVTIQKPVGITVLVEILDVKQSYGKTRWLVKPVNGEGDAWVEAVSIID